MRSVNRHEAVIGLEIHAELLTKTKMFCACEVLDVTLAEPNRAVCPVCAGMPGVLPVINQQAVLFGLKVALALNCQVHPTSIFARKNYFYPDLPKGYQISQYEQPLATNGWLTILTPPSERTIRIRRVHLEEDTGKLTHLGDPPGSDPANPPRSLVDLNRAGIPLLEIVSEPDLHSAEEVRLFAMAIRNILRYLGVNSGDMEKGVLRIEPNVSVREVGSQSLGTRTEIKNLNSFRALERAVAYEIERQSDLLLQGGAVIQQTMGWDEALGVTQPQRSKEQAHDYRYFPEPDLPPLIIDPEQIERVRLSLPELPLPKFRRFLEQYQLNDYDASVLVADPGVGDYFERVVLAAPGISPKTIANWITGELFGLLHQAGLSFEEMRIPPQDLADLLNLLASGEINQNTAKTVLADMFSSGGTAQQIVAAHGLRQISDRSAIADLIREVLDQNPQQVQAYAAGKESLARWFFGQVMRRASGQANPQVIQQELQDQLAAMKDALHKG
jgi:aspartyl-tRNA(Asn)/glutamyl-tRNA(Gln) amidotransferase subunit B